MWLVVGLGNPGPQYAANRHNVGFMIVDELLRRGGGGPPKIKMGAEIVETTISKTRALLCKPMEFMNVSGQAVARVAAFWKVDPAHTIVVHDEMDIPFPRLKLGVGGGPGGHNGVRSIISAFAPDTARVRVGVGRPPAGWDPANYVLANFTKEEGKELPFFVNDAADAVEAIVGVGITAAMNKFNAAQKLAKPPAKAT